MFYRPLLQITLAFERMKRFVFLGNQPLRDAPLVSSMNLAFISRLGGPGHECLSLPGTRVTSLQAE